MNRTEAISWFVKTLTGCLHWRQVQTLAELVAAALRVERVCLAAIAQQMQATTTLKHRIKRVWRFLDNPRFEVSDAMQAVVSRVLAKHRRRPLVIALDWCQVRQFHTLAAVAVSDGRGLPLLWYSYPEWEFYKSQNNLEEGLLRLLKTMLPERTRPILLADRGFGRTELARVCQQIGFHYVIRISPDVWIQSDRHRGNLSDYPVKRGVRRVLRNVRYRQKNPVVQHVVVYWKRKLPKDRDECWFLMTDLDASAPRLTELYGHRMTIEECFRDHKSRRNGFALRNTQVQTARRFDRLLLVLALAYLLLAGLGLHAKERYCPSNWSTNTRPAECSIFTIGKRLLDDLTIPLDDLIHQIAKALLKTKGINWG